MVKSNSLGSKVFDGFNVVFLVLVTLACLLPMWYTLMVSFSEKAAIQAGAVFLAPVGFNTVAYETILSDSRFFQSFWVSLQRVLLSGAFTMAVLVLMGYPLSKTSKQMPGRGLVMWTLVFFMLFNGGLVPWYITMRNYGLFDNVWGLVLAGGVPIFNLILVMNFMKQVPEEIEEAARIDGAGPWRFLFRILVPLSMPVLATVLLFTMVGHWNDFFQGMVLSTQEASFPLQTYIQQLVVATSLDNLSKLNVEQVDRLLKLNNQGLNAAKIFIAMIPVLIVYPFLQRYFVKGITLGAVKG